VTPAELVRLLTSFYDETIELMQQRQARARAVTAYDANNAYQQVLGRQDVHLQWLAAAIADLGGEVPVSGSGGAPPAASGELATILEADALSQNAFLDRWTPTLDTISNARNRKLLELILGEMREHGRMFEQALERRSDVLGPHADGKVLRGTVLPDRPRA
jgi:hypothetical protein